MWRATPGEKEHIAPRALSVSKKLEIQRIKWTEPTADFLVYRYRHSEREGTKDRAHKPNLVSSRTSKMIANSTNIRPDVHVKNFCMLLTYAS